MPAPHAPRTLLGSAGRSGPLELRMSSCWRQLGGGHGPGSWALREGRSEIPALRDSVLRVLPVLPMATPGVWALLASSRFPHCALPLPSLPTATDSCFALAQAALAAPGAPVSSPLGRCVPLLAPGAPVFPPSGSGGRAASQSLRSLHLPHLCCLQPGAHGHAATPTLTRGRGQPHPDVGSPKWGLFASRGVCSTLSIYFTKICV